MLIPILKNSSNKLYNKELIDNIEAIGASFAVFEFDFETNTFLLISSNSMYEELIGKPKNESINKPLNMLFPRYLYKLLLDSFNECITKQVALETEFLIEYKATERWWRSIISPIIEKKQNKVRVIQTCVEITEKKRLEKKLNTSMQRYQAVVQSAYDGIITIDEFQNIKLINNAANEIFGFTSEEVIGQPLTKLIPQKYRPKHTHYVDGFKNRLLIPDPCRTAHQCGD